MDVGSTVRAGQEYRITRTIAAGGMGTVYEAQQAGPAGFSKTVAMKLIRGDLAADAEFVRLFIGEAKLVADLVHENIVQVYSLGRAGAAYYIVMEYVDGIDLDRYLQHHRGSGVPLPVELGAFIASRVCRGLEYAHRKRGRRGEELGIVHRDVSPKNVLLSFEGVVKITDFGIAKARRVMEQDEELLMGHVQYMSPEQAVGAPTDGRSDIYALGVVLHELLTGELPSSASAPGPLRAAAPPPELRAGRPELPAPLCAVVERALASRPERRFQSAGEMGAALEHYMYNDRYGPTNLTLREYLREHFGGAGSEGEAVPTTTSDALVEQRAETLFGPRLRRLPTLPDDE